MIIGTKAGFEIVSKGAAGRVSINLLEPLLQEAKAMTCFLQTALIADSGQ
jgi:hypothetical protein